MNNEYHDIRNRIAEPPKWWDEFAVPRYCDFAPTHAANIYAREAALLSIECQACRAPFKVCMTAGRGLADAIKDGSLHYGDPPNIECCLTGPSMNCVDVRVLEFWHRDVASDWERDPSLETHLEGRR